MPVTRSIAFHYRHCMDDIVAKFATRGQWLIITIHRENFTAAKTGLEAVFDRADVRVARRGQVNLKGRSGSGEVLLQHAGDTEKSRIFGGNHPGGHLRQPAGKTPLGFKALTKR